MRYMLVKTYTQAAHCDLPIHEWAPEDVEAHIAFQRALGEQLAASGELVDAQGLAGPDQAVVVVSDGRTAPVVTDGPFRFTRNPLYVAATGVYLGVALWVDGLVPLLLAVPMMAILHWGVVRREERYLAAKFGEPYREYRSRVRRWF